MAIKYIVQQHHHEKTVTHTHFSKLLSSALYSFQGFDISDINLKSDLYIFFSSSRTTTTTTTTAISYNYTSTGTSTYLYTIEIQVLVGYPLGYHMNVHIGPNPRTNKGQKPKGRKTELFIEKLKFRRGFPD
jgi:hypothetical protein